MNTTTLTLPHADTGIALDRVAYGLLLAFIGAVQMFPVR